MFNRDNICNFLTCGTILSVAPHQLLVGWGPRKEFAASSPENQATFYAPDFFLSTATPWFTHKHLTTIDCTAFLEILGIPPKVSEIAWKNTFKDLFLAEMQQLKMDIQANILTKAVPFVFSTASQTMTTQQLHRSLIQAVQYIQHHPGHLYGTWNQQEGICGVTPETLFSVKKNDDNWTLTTRALAGTAPIGHTLDNPKLIHEHQVVVDGITQALAPFGTPTVGARQALELPHLRHLMTPIEVSLKQPPVFEEIVQAMHPTPALGAHPRAAGQRWLKNYQQRINRFRFGAPLGYTNPEKQFSHCLVAIRNVQWQPDRMLIGAGCGVVADSDPEMEWDEILLKIKATKELLAL